MAMIAPLYGILIFISILCGIGGSVLTANTWGEDDKKENAYFTAAAVMLIAGLMFIIWTALMLFHEQIFTFFGADKQTIPKVIEYARWVIAVLPMLLAPTFISAFIRNDSAPGLAMIAVITGSCVNIVGDWLFVFPMGMSMSGAAMASALGTVVLAILINNQITRYGDANALAVCGVVTTVASLFQFLLGGAGQAIQPIASAICGVKQFDRFKTVWRISLGTVPALGTGFTLIGECFPHSLSFFHVCYTRGAEYCAEYHSLLLLAVQPAGCDCVGNLLYPIHNA